MKIRAALITLLVWSGVASAEGWQGPENSVGGTDTSLVILNEMPGLLTSDPQELYAGTYYNERNQVEVQVLRSGRISTNIVIKNQNQQFPVTFDERLHESRLGWLTRGSYTVGFFTTVGVLYCSYPVTLIANFYEEGETMEVEIDYPSYSGVTTYGQCVSGPTKTEAFELTRDAGVR